MDINLLSKKTTEEILHHIKYRHTSGYKRHLADPVSVEKKILIDRGIDEFNVGHTTRSIEIEQLIENELRDAEMQFGNHLQEYKIQYAAKLSELATKQDEAAQLTKDLADLKKHILNLESFFKEEES